MRLDARDLPPDTTLKTDVLVVGAGPAGISLASGLNGSRYDVLLLESGGEESGSQVSELNAGELIGHPFQFALADRGVQGSRLRGFGGTTQHWGGLSRPFDVLDLGPDRPAGEIAWPQGLTGLPDVLPEAARLCGVSDEWEVSTWTGRFGAATDRLTSEQIRTAIFQSRLPPIRFGPDHGGPLLRSTNVTVCFHGTAVELIAPADGRMVTNVRVATQAGSGLDVQARHVVLAAGGIEIPRLLLASNRERPQGIGNENDLVGRYFTDHPVYFGGQVQLTVEPSDTDLYRLTPHEVPVPGRPGETSVVFSSAGIEIDPVRRNHEGLRRAFVFLAAPPEFDDSTLGIEDPIQPVDIATMLAAGERGTHAATLPLIVEHEPIPNRNNRVQLGTQTDEFGVPLPVVHWDISDDDRQSIRRTLEILGDDLGHRGLGRLRLGRGSDDPVSEDMWVGFHHMASTRMHDDPTLGVVDEDARVHGLANLFIASSSIFPVVGAANPTLNIVAFSLRLAAHLSRLLERR